MWDLANKSSRLTKSGKQAGGISDGWHSATADRPIVDQSLGASENDHGKLFLHRLHPNLRNGRFCANRLVQSHSAAKIG